jgi:enediyne biosynthesis protein E4
MVSQVDGGTGHSGKRSPELHFGLGRIDESVTLRVDLRWRDSNGRIREATQYLNPGWHTILLGERLEGKQ